MEAFVGHTLGVATFWFVAGAFFYAGVWVFNRLLAFRVDHATWRVKLGFRKHS